jgi:hypothetical protein
MRPLRSLRAAAPLGRLAPLGLALALAVATPRGSRADDAAGRAPPTAGAQAVPADLMAGLASHAARFEEMKRRGAFTMNGRMEELDGDGVARNTKVIELRSTPTHAPMDRMTNVIRYLENGEDKTSDAQERADKRRTKRLGDPDTQAEERKKDLKLPFLAGEQSRYTFALVERDAAQPSHVRVAFAPKIPAENAIKGSAWIDEKERAVLSVGFSLSKNPSFIDHVDITIVFGLATALGRAPSRLSFDGRGGFLFVHKHYRGSAVLSQPAFPF